MKIAAQGPGLTEGSLTNYEGGGTQKDEYGPDEVVSVPCPLCAATEGFELYREHGLLGIRRCARCALIYTSPRVRDPEHAYWGEYESYLAEARLIFSGRAEHHRDVNYLEELGLIERHRPQRGRFLDVGCNMGMLLRHAEARGWEVTGVEPSPSLHRIAREQLGLRVHNCYLEDVPDGERGTYDVVALSDVFEHVTEPRQLLVSAGRFLRPEGLLYVKVPNASWNILKQRMLSALGRRPTQGVWDSHEHVVHYTEPTLRAMLASEGYEPVEMTISRPVQVPVWHHYVGQYFQYSSPWLLDWKRHVGRMGFFAAAKVERFVRRGAIGYCAPNLVALARRAG